MSSVGKKAAPKTPAKISRTQAFLDWALSCFHFGAEVEDDEEDEAEEVIVEPVATTSSSKPKATTAPANWPDLIQRYGEADGKLAELEGWKAEGTVELRSLMAKLAGARRFPGLQRQLRRDPRPRRPRRQAPRHPGRPAARLPGQENEPGRADRPRFGLQGSRALRHRQTSPPRICDGPRGVRESLRPGTVPAGARQARRSGDERQPRQDAEDQGRPRRQAEARLRDRQGRAPGAARRGQGDRARPHADLSSGSGRSSTRPRRHFSSRSKRAISGTRTRRCFPNST